MITFKLNPKKEKPVIGVRIVDNKYADGFVKKGIIHFSFPDSWTDIREASGHQLDTNEGCFCLSVEDNDEALKERGRLFAKVDNNNGLYRYFSDSSKILCCCFYGINKSDFVKQETAYGIEKKESCDFKVDGSYFKRFNNKDSKDKATIIIFDLPALENRLIEKLIEFGFQRNDIFVSPVYYVCKNLPYYCNEPFPFEFFLKDLDYAEQSEFRILINCSDKKVLKKFCDCECNIALGDISDISCLQDYYKDDLCFSIQGKKLLYSLATPIHTHINEMAFEDLVALLLQIQDNRLPQGVLSEEEIDAHMKPIEALLRDKFHVIYIREQRFLANVTDELNRRLQTIFKRRNSENN